MKRKNIGKIGKEWEFKMKKVLVILLGGLMLTGCGCSKRNTAANTNNNSGSNGNNNTQNEQINGEQTVMQDQMFEGLEFVNVGASDGVIKTIVINNTGYVYEGSKFKMVIMDENGGVLTEEIDEVRDSMEAGTTREMETPTNADLSRAASIEYSIVIE